MKRIITLFIAISILSSLSLISANAAEKHNERPAYGDVNHDGLIDLQDVVTTQKHIAKLNDFTMCRACANVNGDEVDLTDVVCIQKYIAKLKVESKCGKAEPEFAAFVPRLLDKETEEKIIQAFMEADPISDERKEYLMKNHGRLVLCDYYDTLSDGTLLVWARYPDSKYPAMSTKYEIGDYICRTSNANLLIGNKYLSVKDAYDQGLLSEEIFEELVFKLHLTKNSDN